MKARRLSLTDRDMPVGQSGTEWKQRNKKETRAEAVPVDAMSAVTILGP